MTAIGIVLAHLLGDYVFQNNWMANTKTSRWLPAVIHGSVYTAMYAVILQPSVVALLVIGSTHVVIDRFRLVKQLIWVLNQVAPKSFRYSWAEAKANGGYAASTPVWLSTWLMIIVDNTVHLVINTASILWL
ncbi:DUF3307 domain-containing protein [Herbiconiux solani]|uniref:DUF3307 domain-containing protein n=1 Tax=Herbiconiux solani TaxID=661329 RepID=UPI000826EE21|nr:DUF3307 domain-containing protein [Herbiconiux solani]